MPDTDASKLDAWLREVRESLRRVEEYHRRLVREDIHPPAEPDQDVLDVSAICETYALGISSEEGCQESVRQALTTIKDRVRREERCKWLRKYDPQMADFIERGEHRDTRP